LIIFVGDEEERGLGRVALVASPVDNIKTVFDRVVREVDIKKGHLYLSFHGLVPSRHFNIGNTIVEWRLHLVLVCRDEGVVVEIIKGEEKIGSGGSAREDRIDLGHAQVTVTIDETKREPAGEDPVAQVVHRVTQQKVGKRDLGLGRIMFHLAA
jgi:hypothetical protein